MTNRIICFHFWLSSVVLPFHKKKNIFFNELWLAGRKNDKKILLTGTREKPLNNPAVTKKAWLLELMSKDWKNIQDYVASKDRKNSSTISD